LNATKFFLQQIFKKSSGLFCNRQEQKRDCVKNFLFERSASSLNARQKNVFLRAIQRDEAQEELRTQ